MPSSLLQDLSSNSYLLNRTNEMRTKQLFAFHISFHNCIFLITSLKAHMPHTWSFLYPRVFPPFHCYSFLIAFAGNRSHINHCLCSHYKHFGRKQDQQGNQDFSFCYNLTLKEKTVSKTKRHHKHLSINDSKLYNVSTATK